MERTALSGRLSWQLGEVIATHPETERTKSLTLAVPNWPGHQAGQHVDIRLTAENGYQAQRSYSIASPPAEMALEVILTLTRTQPPGWTGYRRRMDAELLREVAWSIDQRPLTFICGPTQFVETAAANLLALGYEPMRIKTERFGPTGDA